MTRETRMLTCSNSAVQRMISSVGGQRNAWECVRFLDESNLENVADAWMQGNFYFIAGMTLPEVLWVQMAAGRITRIPSCVKTDERGFPIAGTEELGRANGLFETEHGVICLTGMSPYKADAIDYVREYNRLMSLKEVCNA